MKRKVFIFTLLSLCLWCGCTETLDYLVPDSQVCVNAIMDATSGYNKIYCTRLDGGKSWPMENVSLQLYRNGELVETILHAADDEPGVFISNATFQPGDSVRIEVNCPEANKLIYAETQVPFPVQITGADTLSLVQTFNDSRTEARCRIQLDLRKTDPRPTYYRLMSGFQIRHQLSVAECDYETGTLIAERDSISQKRTYLVDILDDLALTDGKGYVESERNDVLGYVTIYKNKFRIFSDLFFSQNRYQLTYYTVPYLYHLTPAELASSSFIMQDPNHFLYGKSYKILGFSADGTHQFLLYSKGYNAKLFYDVISISADEYHYLKGISVDDSTGDQNEPFMNPIVLPYNVHNAIGIFAIEYSAHGEIKNGGVER